MVRRHVSRFAAFCIVCTLVAAGTLPAYAGWDVGILTATNVTVESSVPKEVDAKEAYSTEVLRLVNVQRSAAGLEALQELAGLTSAAAIRASEASISFSHKRPGNLSCSTVFTDNGLIYSHAGENLAYGFKNPSDLVKSWMASKGHRENILSSKFVYGGIGYFQNAKGVTYCSLLLYTPKAK